jgi:cytochrome c peroxidase
LARSRALVELGRTIFFDRRLSADGKTSCASCHQPEHAFQDGLPVARGAFGQRGTRNTPSLLNVSEQRTLFWDGRRSSLSEQALDPMRNPREHGLASDTGVLAKLAALPDYAALLAGVEAHDAPDSHAVRADSVARALAAFENQLADGESAFDRHRDRGDSNALPAAAQRGWTLFSGRAQCIACHQVGDRKPALFTDHAFHALPVRGERAGARLADLVNRFVALKGAGRSLDDILLSDDEMATLGRFAVTLDPADIGAFKTPSLRNVALTSPYMHDGSVATLPEAIELEVYYRGARDGHPLILTDGEKADLLAFLHSLTSYRPPQ